MLTPPPSHGAPRRGARPQRGRALVAPTTDVPVPNPVPEVHERTPTVPAVTSAGPSAGPSAAPSPSSRLAPRPRSQDTPDAIQRAALLLGGSAGLVPGTWASHRRMQRPEVCRFYAEGVVGKQGAREPILWHLERVAHNGGPLYVQGVAHGVGTTTLLLDYVAAYNTNAEGEGLPQIGYVDVAEHCTSIKHLLDTIASELRLRIPTTDLRLRSARALLDRVSGHLLHRGVGTLVLDHVGNVSGTARDFVATLLREYASESRRKIRAQELGRSFRPFGLILADRAAPTALFGKHPGVLVALEGQAIILDRYRTVAQMAEALVQAAVGVTAVDLDDPSDRGAMEDLLEFTHGLPRFMHRAFEYLHALHDRHPGKRLRVLVRGIPKYMQRHVRLREDALTEDGPPLVTLSATPPRTARSAAAAPVAAEAEDVQVDARARAGAPGPVRSRAARTRSQVIADRQHARAVAEADRTDLLRHGQGARTSRRVLKP